MECRGGKCGHIHIGSVCNPCGKWKDETFSQIVWKIRLPRILAAILLGGALSVSGFLLQSFFQNPIAGPYVLGISSGAKLVVALTMIFLLEKAL